MPGRGRFPAQALQGSGAAGRSRRTLDELGAAPRGARGAAAAMCRRGSPPRAPSPRPVPATPPAQRGFQRSPGRERGPGSRREGPGGKTLPRRGTLFPVWKEKEVKKERRGEKRVSWNHMVASHWQPLPRPPPAPPPAPALAARGPRAGPHRLEPRSRGTAVTSGGPRPCGASPSRFPLCPSLHFSPASPFFYPSTPSTSLRDLPSFLPPSSLSPHFSPIYILWAPLSHLVPPLLSFAPSLLSSALPVWFCHRKPQAGQKDD